MEEGGKGSTHPHPMAGIDLPSLSLIARTIFVRVLTASVMGNSW